MSTQTDWVQENVSEDVQKTEIQTRKLEGLNPAKLRIPYDTSNEVEGILIEKKKKKCISLGKDSGRDA